MGISIGVSNLVYSKMTSDGPAVYETVKKLAEIVNIGIKPNISTETLYASNVAIATATTMGQIDLDFEIDQLDKAVANDLLGVSQNDDGVTVYDGVTVAPYVAIGFESLCSDGSKELVWITKLQFALPEDSYETKGDKVTFQTKKLTATAICRDDKVWKYQINSNDVPVGKESIVTNWFNAVYAPSAV